MYQQPQSLDCCGGLGNVDYSKVDFSAMAFLLSYVDVTDSIFGVTVFFIAFNPLFWNLVARWEHKTRALTRTFRSPYTACYSLAAVILLLNVLRSHCFTEAMKSQPKLDALDSLPAYYAGAGLVAVGVVFVLSSFLALGFVGTFLGDYFGILMEAKVTCFPFSILDNPMYWGSTAIYLGWALMPFTEEIYRQKAVKSQ
ncbi:phosphatidylethanolamine N-methyltransferase isoform X2 [Heteronotia binoei]|uniref:phosphatidylethanolamine N-methyltransferase isoform X2 n=1 Tax=Heteronotia binoei TaxID=13085 RepID=UPI00292FEBE2|nr:phosphatidylethanolamine N-methyltransferase isoform X2 [Heteronotia binoei]